MAEAICPNCNDYLVYMDSQNPMGWTCHHCQNWHEDGTPSHHCNICHVVDVCDPCASWDQGAAAAPYPSISNNWAAFPFWQIKARPAVSSRAPAAGQAAAKPTYLGFDGVNVTLNIQEDGKSNTYLKVNTIPNSNLVTLQHPSDPKFFSVDPNTHQLQLGPVAAGQAPAQWEFVNNEDGSWCIYAYHVNGGGFLRAGSLYSINQSVLADAPDATTATRFDLAGAQSVPGCCLIM
eukprot:gnl/Hemi2/13519_TR4622_c0_g3_i1.p1 gnl/Hemi2/13519_TR4622_c0_g3~~gnl/Hemi2/13519_TR4622_c0_g3_i1.p1  ORF type:complete len:263 (+),score=112.73 gnl/Hemi2/13519_TR4622_c0_g3_i1:88-789(+)